jgi:hypothetical protein
VFAAKYIVMIAAKYICSVKHFVFSEVGGQFVTRLLFFEGDILYLFLL